MAQAADHAHQPLRPERDRPHGTKLPPQDHGRLPLQAGWRRGRRHQQTGNDRMVARSAGRILHLGVSADTLAVLAACTITPAPVASAPTPVAPAPTPVASAPTPVASRLPPL